MAGVCWLSLIASLNYCSCTAFAGFSLKYLRFLLYGHRSLWSIKNLVDSKNRLWEYINLQRILFYEDPSYLQLIFWKNNTSILPNTTILPRTGIAITCNTVRCFDLRTSEFYTQWKCLIRWAMTRSKLMRRELRLYTRLQCITTRFRFGSKQRVQCRIYSCRLWLSMNSRCNNVTNRWITSSATVRDRLDNNQ